MSDGSFCVVFRPSLSTEYQLLLDGYLRPVQLASGATLYCAFCSSVAPAERFILLRLTQQTDLGHVWSVRVPVSLVMAIIDQSEAQNPIGFQALVDQLAD